MKDKKIPKPNIESKINEKEFKNLIETIKLADSHMEQVHFHEKRLNYHTKKVYGCWIGINYLAELILKDSLKEESKPCVFTRALAWFRNIFRNKP